MSDQSPASRVDNWPQVILSKLEQVGEIAREVGANAVLDGGDFFHIKSPSRTSHKTILDVVRVHNKYPCPVFANVGNHDVKYGDYTYLPESPLGVLFGTGVFHPCFLDSEVYLVERDRRVSWHRDWADGDLVVRVVGVPYHGVHYEDRFWANARKGREDFLVVMSHQLASQSGGSMFEGEDILKYDDVRKLTNADVVLFGHWHKNQGVSEGSFGTTIVNIGSMSRGSLSLDDLERVPSVAILSLVKGSHAHVDVRPLAVDPVDKVFDLTRKAIQDDRESRSVDLVRSLRSSILAKNEGSLIDVVRSVSVEDRVKEEAILYLERA